MSRTTRLLDLLQLLRNRSAPVSGQDLAAELGVSIRTLYRDIVTLQAQGADIRGEPGLGYVLQPGFMLPPLMFTTDEIEAIVLGSRWVAARGADARLSQAAGQALSKITAVLPAELRSRADATALLVARGQDKALRVDPAAIRLAVRGERKIAIRYDKPGEGETARVIWPFLIAFFDDARLVVGWCELRQGYRAFRVDRITALQVLDARYPRRRAELAKEWRQQQNIPPP